MLIMMAFYIITRYYLKPRYTLKEELIIEKGACKPLFQMFLTIIFNLGTSSCQMWLDG